QLQEMLPQNDKDNYDWMCHLGKLESFVTEFSPHGESFTDYIWGFSTWEQLWLAFYMSEKYNKVWDGDKWK
ncbi:hypothetical protein LCGC14_1206450, partial [marine sediment metagenome]